MNKANLEKIKAAANVKLENAKTAEEIDEANELVKSIEALEEEFEETEKNNASLLKSYKESLKAQPFKKDPYDEPDEEDTGRGGMSFKEALKTVLSKREK